VTTSRPLPPAHLDRASYLAFLAHEVRNPMSIALWSAELMGRLRPEDRAGERGLKLASLGTRALGRIQQLVEDHLLCERLDAGGYPLRLGTVEVAGLLGTVLERLGLVPAPELHLAPGLAGRGDRVLLERAIEGVVAVAGRAGAAVRIEGEAAAGQVRIAIRGAPVERLEDPLKGSPSDPSGRALALPMSRRVAMAHGGTLTLEGDGYLLAFPAT